MIAVRIWRHAVPALWYDLKLSIGNRYIVDPGSWRKAFSLFVNLPHNMRFYDERDFLNLIE